MVRRGGYHFIIDVRKGFYEVASNNAAATRRRLETASLTNFLPVL
jgi:hypothetical protein